MMSEVAHLHPDVAKAFDSLARQYDELFGDNAIIERLRKKVYSTIDFLVRPPAEILDINCGTGTDGLYLADKGFTVVGVDLSASMIAEAAQKSREFPNARFMEGSYEDLNHVESNRFDLVLSNFGGLNCTRNLPRVGAQVAAKLKPGGYFIAVIMPSFSLWETIAYGYRGRIKEAFRRMKPDGTETQFYGNPFMVYYFSPREVVRAFDPDFEIIETYSLNVFSPPPHAWKIAARFPILTAISERIDDLISHLPLFRSIGDHNVIVLRKRVR
ncbi:MAG: class I SAM-dependent methyltransferase [Bacteroidota bacterium]|jgi:SAM-dependent methyltransferase